MVRVFLLLCSWFVLEAEVMDWMMKRAVRGGSWFSGPRDMRYTARLMQRTGDSNDFTGVRVVRAISG